MAAHPTERDFYSFELFFFLGWWALVRLTTGERLFGERATNVAFATRPSWLSNRPLLWWWSCCAGRCTFAVRQPRISTGTAGSLLRAATRIHGHTRTVTR